ncbi:MAG TPA: integrase arm-type DNA-binding domain-containing protein, partial [Acetobacteraceae bacterium]
MGLSLDFIKTCRVPGKWRDEENLYLVIPPRNPAGGTWQLLYSLGGKARAMGLGSRVGKNAPGRDAVREAARDARKLLRQGLDPLAERAAGTRAEVAQGTSFTSAAERYIAAHEAGWRNRKHSQQWRNTLAAYVHPVLGKLPVGAISTDDVMRVLEPLWTRLPATASRVRSRIEAVLDYAKARGWRDGENVARWRGHLALLLPARGKVRAVQHHPALDWRLAPAFMAKLRAEPGIAARALEFLILTAARSGEGRGAAWAEIDASEAAWMVPAGRMKRRRTHRVPLSAAALAVLARVQ